MAKRGTLTHRRTRRLAATLGIHLPYAFGLMEALWHSTADKTPRGDIGRLTDQEIADEIWWPEDSQRLVSAFVTAGLLEESPQYRLLVHGWSEHADNSVRKKLSRAKTNFADGSIPWPGRGDASESKDSESDSRGTPRNAIGHPAVPSRAKPCQAKPSRKQKAASAASESSGPSDKDDAITVLEYWLKATGYVIRSPKAHAQILARVKSRLRDGCSVDDLRACVDFALSDEFYLSKGYSKKPDVIWRSAERVGDLANRWEAARTGTKPERYSDFPNDAELMALAAEDDRAAGGDR